MNEGMREDAILWEVEPDRGLFGGRGSLMVSQYQVGIVMQDGEVVDVFSGGRRDLPKGEVRTYVASTAPFTLTFWLMDPMDREEPDDGVVLGQPVLTSDDEAVTGRLALTMRVVWKNVEYLLQLLRPGSGGVTRRDVSDAIEGELLAKVLDLDIHQHTAEELRGNRDLFRGIYESVNIELASTIRFYGLQLDNFTVSWGLTSEERERIRERRHEEQLREIRRRQEIEDLANRARERERQDAEQLGEIERRKERERRYEEELREMERQREILEKQRELMEGRRDLADLSEPVKKEPAGPRRQSDETETLHNAVLGGDSEAALAIISGGADVNGRDGEYGVTPLHVAAFGGHTETVLALVSVGAAVNARNKVGVTPLHVAAFEGHTETLLVLIRVGAEVNARDKRLLTPLHSAATAGHTETAQALVSVRANVNARDVFGRTPLHSTAVDGKAETALALVSAGADVDARDVFGRTPLHSAAHWGHTETGRALVSAGADVYAKNEDGLTPAHLAEMGGHRETASAVMRLPLGCLFLHGRGVKETARTPSSSIYDPADWVDTAYEKWRSNLMDKLESTGAGQTAGTGQAAGVGIPRAESPSGTDEVISRNNSPRSWQRSPSATDEVSDSGHEGLSRDDFILGGGCLVGVLIASGVAGVLLPLQIFAGIFVLGLIATLVGVSTEKNGVQIIGLLFLMIGVVGMLAAIARIVS